MKPILAILTLGVCLTTSSPLAFGQSAAAAHISQRAALTSILTQQMGVRLNTPKFPVVGTLDVEAIAPALSASIILVGSHTRTARCKLIDEMSYQCRKDCWEKWTDGWQGIEELKARPGPRGRDEMNHYKMVQLGHLTTWKKGCDQACLGSATRLRASANNAGCR